MDLNLKKNEFQLTSTWKKFTKSVNIGDWICYGYEARTCTLQHVSSGDGGLKALEDELSDGLIMYAGVIVKDPNSELPKIVFIIWQGLGVPEQVRGRCATHHDAVCHFFKGFHINIIARGSEEIREDNILANVKKSSGANYSVHKEVAKKSDAPTHIVSSYTKIDPKKEVSAASKLSFWEKNAHEENTPAEKPSETRIKELKSISRSNEKLVKDVQKEQEQRDKEVERLKEQRKKEVAEALASKSTFDDNILQSSEGTNQGRVQEAKELATGKTKNIKAMFEKKPEPEPVKVTSSRPTSGVKKWQPVNLKSDDKRESVSIAQAFIAKSTSPSTVQPVTPHNIVRPEPTNIVKPEPTKDPGYNEETRLEPPVSSAPSASSSARQSLNKKQLDVVALYDYESTEDNEISFREGEILKNIAKDDEEWWTGTNEKGHRGFIPYNFVAEMDSPEAIEVLNHRNAMSSTVSASNNSVLSKTVEETLPTVKVLFDYEAAEEGELNIFEDEILYILEKRADGWWVAKNKSGEIGEIPSNFVE